MGKLRAFKNDLRKIYQKSPEIEALENPFLYTVDELINLETKEISDERVCRKIHEIK